MPTGSSSASSAVSSSGVTVTLADIERETAPRLGPYRADTASGGTAETLACAALTSSIDLGGVADLYLLRRAATAGDRQRQVKAYEPTSGTLTVDRAWAVAPTNGEAFELHYLDPANELRPAVLAGLRRCYFVDRATITPASAAAERNVTTLAGWITDPEQILGVDYALAGNALQPPAPVLWWSAFSAGGAVYLRGADPYPQNLLLTARRPHFTWVNGADSPTGPTLDADTLAVAIEYAAAAAHIEAWRRLRPRLQPVAQTGLAVSMAEAAAEFTRQAQVHYQPPAPPQRFASAFASQSVVL